MHKCVMKLSLTLSAVLLITGCAPETLQRYQVSEENINMLSQRNDMMKLAVGQFEKGPVHELNCDPISIRGLELHSPYDDSFAKYIEEALKLELSLSDKYDPAAEVKVAGVVLKNDMSTAGHGIIEVTFRVMKGTTAKYEATIISTSRWRKAFSGAAAYGMAVRQYSPLVSQLLKKLFTDQKFIESVTK